MDYDGDVQRAQNCFDFEVLFDPLKKQFDAPASPIDKSDGLGF